LGLDENVGVGAVSESAHEVGAFFIRAGESCSSELDDLVLGGLDSSEGWGDAGDVGRSIE